MYKCVYIYGWAYWYTECSRKDKIVLGQLFLKPLQHFWVLGNPIRKGKFLGNFWLKCIKLKDTLKWTSRVSKNSSSFDIVHSQSSYTYQSNIALSVLEKLSLGKNSQ